jgi:hypothetical protein
MKSSLKLFTAFVAAFFLFAVPFGMVMSEDVAAESVPDYPEGIIVYPVTVDSTNYNMYVGEPLPVYLAIELPEGASVEGHSPITVHGTMSTTEIDTLWYISEFNVYWVYLFAPFDYNLLSYIINFYYRMPDTNGYNTTITITVDDTGKVQLPVPDDLSLQMDFDLKTGILYQLDFGTPFSLYSGYDGVMSYDPFILFFEDVGDYHLELMFSYDWHIVSVYLHVTETEIITTLSALIDDPGNGDDGTDPGDDGTDPGDDGTDPGDDGTDLADKSFIDKIGDSLENFFDDSSRWVSENAGTVVIAFVVLIILIFALLLSRGNHG